MDNSYKGGIIIHTIKRAKKGRRHHVSREIFAIPYCDDWCLVTFLNIIVNVTWVRSRDDVYENNASVVKGYQ